MANAPAYSSSSGLPIYKSATGAPAYRPFLSCTECCPPIDSQLTVTLSGLAGTLSGYNGAHTVYQVSSPSLSCIWADVIDTSGGLGSSFNVILEGAAIGQDGWLVTVTNDTGNPAGGCRKMWCRGVLNDTLYECHPEGTYNDTCLSQNFTCYDSGCADSTTCSGSSGASCVVS